MRGLFVCSCTLIAASGGIVHAEPDDGIAKTAEPAAVPMQPQVIGYGALPGGPSVPDAMTLPPGAVEIEALGGFGYRKGLLADDHRFGRGIGDLAFAYAPIDSLAIALALDGRYDRHYGLPPSGDDGYVGDPRLLIRFAKAAGANQFGIQAGVWVPGKNAPSIAGSAISVDARLLASFALGPARLSLEAGFRLDNSAKSVDDVTMLSAQDRISLGVSDYNAAIAGVRVVYPGKTGFLSGEVSTDIFFGSKAPPGSTTAIDAPGPIIRGGITGGLHLSSAVSLLAYVEIAKVPSIDATMIAAGNIPLIPWEPMVTGGIGISARFGGPKRPAAIVETGPSENACVKTNTCKSIEVVDYAEVTGTVTDQNGKPIVGGQVTIKLKNETGTAVTDDKGGYVVSKLKIGKTVDGAKSLDDTGAEVSVSVAGKKPGGATLTLAEGTNKAPTIKLEPDLPPGQLRGTVRNAASGRAIAGATITIEPGGTTAVTDADGRFTIDLPPGTYKATAKAEKLSPQSLDVTIEPDPNGAAVIKNFELRK